jgi:hypothetical protein
MTCRGCPAWFLAILNGCFYSKGAKAQRKTAKGNFGENHQFVEFYGNKNLHLFRPLRLCAFAVQILLFRHRK